MGENFQNCQSFNDNMHDWRSDDWKTSANWKLFFLWVFVAFTFMWICLINGCDIVIIVGVVVVAAAVAVADVLSLLLLHFTDTLLSLSINFTETGQKLYLIRTNTHTHTKHTHENTWTHKHTQTHIETFKDTEIFTWRDASDHFVIGIDVYARMCACIGILRCKCIMNMNIECI